jgi:ribonucleoside-diphosphate reductase alpha chain
MFMANKLDGLKNPDISYEGIRTMNFFGDFIHQSRYAKWRNDLSRRETWTETVDRYWNWMCGKFPILETRGDIRESILKKNIMPSMRAMMTAGPAADRDNTCTYNCSYIALDSPKAMKELCYILMNGTGVGFSVEESVVDQWPTIPESIERADEIIEVEDSKEGWSIAIYELMMHLYEGCHPTWDVSKVRPSGARLKTFGGRASGPGPLEDVFRFITNMFYNKRGKKLKPVDVHDIACSIGNAIVVGGVRRSAMISLSDLTDYEMAKCKSGNWWEQESQRSLANNSAIYNSKPSMSEFLQEWAHLYESRSGERGIFNRYGTQKCMENTQRDNNYKFGTNPCGEITLRSKQFCNLTEVVIRSKDCSVDIEAKIEQATILGTLQSSLTHFPFLSKEWKKNSEEERLLGVSLTGIWDNPITYGKISMGQLRGRLKRWRELTHEINADWANRIGINPSAAITTVKPSGTVSCLVDSASGIHPRYAQQYIRRVRMDIKDPLSTLMLDQGVPHERCTNNPDSTIIFEFPLSAPAGAMTRNEVSAMRHLELWMTYKKYWTDHNPSVTIEYTDDEYMEIGDWVYRNFDDIQGISFLPRTEHVYKQAPFEPIDNISYLTRCDKMPMIKWSKLSEYELEDNTKSSQTLACTGGACELVDLTD